MPSSDWMGHAEKIAWLRANYLTLTPSLDAADDPPFPQFNSDLIILMTGPVYRLAHRASIRDSETAYPLSLNAGVNCRGSMRNSSTAGRPAAAARR